MTTREPLAVRTAIVTAVGAIVRLLVLLKVIDLDPATEAALVTAVDVTVGAVIVLWVRGKVTPVDAPVLTSEQVANGTIWPSTASDTTSTPGEAFKLPGGDDSDDEPRHLATDR